MNNYTCTTVVSFSELVWGPGLLLWSTLSNTDLGASVSALLCVEVQGRVSKLFFANMFPIQETTTTTSTGTTAASYSQETINSVESLGEDFSINIAFNPINLGAKWKLLISRFQNSSWMLNLELNWLRYDRETKPKFSLKFMFLSYSYRFTSIDSFETFYDSR